MSPRWFIPISLIAFVILVGGPSLYLYLTQETEPIRMTSARRTSGDAPVVPDRPDARRSEKQASPGSVRSGLAVWRERVAYLEDLAARADRWSVEFRSDLRAGGVVDWFKGLSARALEQGDAALGHFDRLLARNPTAVGARKARAAILLEQGRFADAVAEFKVVLEQSQVDADARFSLAAALIRLGRYREAARQLRETLARRPDHAAAHYNLASLAQREGRLAEARWAWENFVRLEPQVASAWFNLGVVYADYDMPLEAASCFAAAAQARPDDALAYLNLATVLAAAGHREAAVASVERAAALAPCEPQIIALRTELECQGPGAPIEAPDHAEAAVAGALDAAATDPVESIHGSP